MLEIVNAGVDALIVMEPGDSTVVPATMAAFSAALAPLHELTGQVGEQTSGTGLTVVFQNTYWSEIFPLVAMGALTMLMICFAGSTAPPVADPLQGVDAGKVKVNVFAVAVPAVLLILYVPTVAPVIEKP